MSFIFKMISEYPNGKELYERAVKAFYSFQHYCSSTYHHPQYFYKDRQEFFCSDDKVPNLDGFGISDYRGFNKCPSLYKFARNSNRFSNDHLRNGGVDNKVRILERGLSAFHPSLAYELFYLLTATIMGVPVSSLSPEQVWVFLEHNKVDLVLPDVNESDRCTSCTNSCGVFFPSYATPAVSSHKRKRKRKRKSGRSQNLDSQIMEDDGVSPTESEFDESLLDSENSESEDRSSSDNSDQEEESSEAFDSQSRLMMRKKGFSSAKKKMHKTRFKKRKPSTPILISDEKRTDSVSPPIQVRFFSLFCLYNLNFFTIFPLKFFLLKTLS